MKSKIIAIIGATASGKSDLALKLARDFNGEIVSADSRQFYRGMDIGTNKPSREEQALVPHHLIDIAEPDQTVTLFDYQKKAFEAIDDILSRGKLPIIVGGTGLYVSAAIENYSLTQGAIDSELREQLNNSPLDALVSQLKRLDPATEVDLRNKRRVTRALERLMSAPGEIPSKSEPRYAVMIIEPSFGRKDLYAKIDERVEWMMEHGLADEVAGLSQKYGWEFPAMSGIGYREFAKNRALQADLGTIAQDIKTDTRRYAKRQITWFNRYAAVKYSHTDYSQTKARVSEYLKG